MARWTCEQVCVMHLRRSIADARPVEYIATNICNGQLFQTNQVLGGLMGLWLLLACAQSESQLRVFACTTYSLSNRFV